MQQVVPIDTLEVTEACQLLAAWHGRAMQLPIHLRQRFEALAHAGTDAVSVETIAGVVVVGVSPEVRCLLAGLRALA